MDNSSISRNRNNNDNLGVNRVGKNIKKSPLHQPSFSSPARQQPQPQVYNINKNDFRDFVQQLTGSPSHEQRPRPPPNPTKPQSLRLQKIRPPPLTPMNRPQIHVHPVAAAPAHSHLPPQPPPAQFGQPAPTMLRPLTPTGDPLRANVAESPISAYMRYLQSSFIDPFSEQTQAQLQHQVPGQFLAQPLSSPLLPNQTRPSLFSPRMGGPCLFPSPRVNAPPLPSPRMNHRPSLPSPRMNDYSSFLSPRFSGPPLLPSPTQFLLPSPTGFLNFLSPRSPYPVLSPRYQYHPPLTPDFAFSSMGQSGILGPGPQPQYPPSPGVGFPLSPSAFFPISSPRWRDQWA